MKRKHPDLDQQPAKKEGRDVLFSQEELLDLISRHGGVNPLKSKIESVLQAVMVLPRRGQEIVRQLFGLRDGTPMPLRELAATHGVSSSEMEEQVAQALRSLAGYGSKK